MIRHRRLYNAWTYFLHRILHLPIRLRAAFDNHRRHPELTVIFLHGISATSSTWKSTIRQLQHEPDLENLRLVTLDLLGFGKSLQADWLDYDYPAYQSALRSALKRLKIRSPYVLVVQRQKSRSKAPPPLSPSTCRPHPGFASRSYG